MKRLLMTAALVLFAATLLVIAGPFDGVGIMVEIEHVIGGE